MKKTLVIILALVAALCLVLVACKPCEHVYKDGVCIHCGETDPNYKPPQKDEPLPTDVPKTADEVSLMIHYHREDAAYRSWDFWIWKMGGEGQGCAMTYQDDFGGVGIFPLSMFDATASDKLGIIPRLGGNSWTKKDVDADRTLDLSTFEADENKYIHVYLTEGDVNLYKEIDGMKYAVTAQFSQDNKIVITAKSPVKSVKIFEGETLFATVDGKSQTTVSYAIPAGTQINLDAGYTAEVEFEGKTVTVNVDIQSLYSTQMFDDAFYFDGELGAIYASTETTFRVWSPVSSKIILNVYNSGDAKETPVTHEMTKGEKGVFEKTVAGNLEGKYYTYTVFNGANPNGAEIVDPYAKSAGLNGVRGMVVDFSKTNPSGWESVIVHDYDRKELTVWETHVADVTSSVTWNGTEANRKKFLGVVESGTTYTKGGVTVKTGFDHIKELGVNAVQLIPIFDQANKENDMTFNWGYNPLNYNVLEGGYSSNPSDGYARIREFKQLVQAFNQAGINVIMDVVYNHVNGASGSNFDVLMPGYFYRYTSTGALSNGSGCGNETASDRSMFRKFMIDSVTFWAEEYKLGGFRFDLMGLHDVETMNLLAKALQDVNPTIAIYGEPWTGGGTTLPSGQQAIQSNANSLVGVGQFNDQMRDALIKGGLSASSDKGWVTNKAAKPNAADIKKIEMGLKGITDASKPINDPNKTVNYVTCHDNYTLFDRVKAAYTDAKGVCTVDDATAKKMAMLANSVVFTSNGTTFMLAGEEMLRTKNVDGATADEVHNSYQSSYKVNELNYELKVDNLDLFRNYQKLVEFKQTCSGLHLDESGMAANYTVTTLAEGAVIVITVKDSTNNRTYTIAHANGFASGATVDFGGCTLFLNTLGDNTTLSAATEIKPYQTIIAYK